MRLPRCRVTIAAILTAAAAADGALAQSSYELFSPDAGSPQTFNGSSTGRTGVPSRFQRTLTDGNPPPSGAGSTGFISQAPPAPPESPRPEPLLSGPPADLSAPPPVAEPDDEVVVPGSPRPRRRRDERDDPYEPLGLRLGSFIVKPAIEISGGYDTNPERSLTPRGSGTIVVAPELQARSDWSRHELRLDARGRYRTYPGLDVTPSLDQPFIDSKLAARIDVTRRTRIDLEGRFLLSTEDPNSPDLPAGLAELPVTTTAGVTAGIAHRFNRLELGVSGSYDRITYDPSTLTNGATVSNDDRNYDQYGVKLRGSYETMPGIRPFVEVGFDRRTYDLAVDAGGLGRDSTGSEFRVGSTFEFGRQLTGTASVGYATRRYEDPALEELRGLIADGSLVWTATPLTQVTFTARSRIAESTLAGVSGVLRRDFGAQVDHSFRRWLIGTVRFEYGTDEYVGSPREDQRYALSGMLTYKLSREVQLKGEVRRQWLTSSVTGADYTANIFLVGLRLQR